MMKARTDNKDIASAIKRAADFLLFCRGQKSLSVQTEFDQCHATLQSVLKRVELLSRRIQRNTTRILLLGDDDLLSLALSAAFPDAYITVLDLDENVLNYIDAFKRGNRLETYRADIRSPLPGNLRRQFDMVFSDPPYTLAGQTVFLQRAISAIRPVPGSSIYICFSRFYIKPSAAHEIKKFALSANLHLQETLEDFNVYHTLPDVVEDMQRAGSSSLVLTSSVLIFETKGKDIYLPELPEHFLANMYTYYGGNDATT